MLPIQLRGWLLQKHVDHGTERIELGGASSTNVIPKLTDGKSRSERKGGIRPKRRVARVPESVAMEERQTRIQHIVGAVFEVPNEMPANCMGLCVRTDDALGGSGRTGCIHDEVWIAVANRFDGWRRGAEGFEGTKIDCRLASCG